MSVDRVAGLVARADVDEIALADTIGRGVVAVDVGRSSTVQGGSGPCATIRHPEWSLQRHAHPGQRPSSSLAAP